MIQRRQTLWLLLGTVAAILTFMYPFATGEEIVKGTSLKQRAEVIAGGEFFTLLLTIGNIILFLVTLFFFKDRKLQMKLCLLGLLVSAGIFILYIADMRKLISGTPALWAILPVVTIAAYFLAFRDIRKDEKLVKSLDKLR